MLRPAWRTFQWVKVPGAGGSTRRIAYGKGVRREAESGGYPFRGWCVSPAGAEDKCGLCRLIRMYPVLLACRLNLWSFADLMQGANKSYLFDEFSGPLTLFPTDASAHLNSRSIEAGSCYPLNEYHTREPGHGVRPHRVTPCVLLSAHCVSGPWRPLQS